MKRYLLTDMGNILTTFKYREQLVKEIAAGFGVANIRAQEIFGKNLGDDITDESYYSGLDLGEFNLFQLWCKLLRSHNIPQSKMDYPLFVSLWCRHLEPIRGVVELYRKLQESYPIVVISNGDSEGVRHICYHLMGCYGLRFEEVFISAEHKTKKPELFAQVAAYLEAQKVEPGECIFVDDIPEYTVAAKKFGIPAINFDGSKQPVSELVAALAKHGFTTCQTRFFATQ